MLHPEERARDDRIRGFHVREKPFDFREKSFH